MNIYKIPSNSVIAPSFHSCKTIKLLDYEDDLQTREAACSNNLAFNISLEKIS